jgi:hypothetical protein
MTELYKNPLWKSLTDVADYFARLGGSARFDGFAEWYLPCLVLMCFLDLNAPHDAVSQVKSECDISERLWTQTHKLSNDIKAKLSASAIDKEAVEQFINEVTKRIEKSQSPRQPRELRDWLGFVDAFKKYSVIQL